MIAGDAHIVSYLLMCREFDIAKYEVYLFGVQWHSSSKHIRSVKRSELLIVINLIFRFFLHFEVGLVEIAHDDYRWIHAVNKKILFKVCQ